MDVEYISDEGRTGTGAGQFPSESPSAHDQEEDLSAVWVSDDDDVVWISDEEIDQHMDDMDTDDPSNMEVVVVEELATLPRVAATFDGFRESVLPPELHYIFTEYNGYLEFAKATSKLEKDLRIGHPTMDDALPYNEDLRLCLLDDRWDALYKSNRAARSMLCAAFKP